MQSITSQPQTRRGLIILYLAAVVFYWMALYLYVPTLSVYTKSKTDNLALVGVVLAQYGLWQAVTRFPLGILADWVGRRKPFIIGGFALAGLGALLMGTAGTINGLLVGRAFTGLAASAWVLLVVAFNGQFPPEDAVRATALLTGVNSIARVVATGATGTLNDVGGYPLAFFGAAGAALLAIIVMLFVKEQPRPSKQPSLRSLKELLTRPDVLVPSLLCAVLQYAVWTGTFTFSPILAQRLGASGVSLSLLASMNIALVMLGSFTTSAVARRLGARAMIILSFVLLGVALGLLALASSLTWVFVAQFCFGLASGVGYSVLMGLSIRHVDETQRASAMGLFQAVYAIGMFTGPWLSGILADGIGVQPMFGVVGAACVVIGLTGTQKLRPASLPPADAR